MSIASQIERLQGVRKEINTKLQELKLTDTDKDFQGISDTLNTVVTNPVINDTLTVTKTSVTVPKGFYDTEGTVNIVTEEKTATTNGEVIPTEGKVLSKVIVNVPSTTVKLQEKTATPSQAEQVISPDSGYDGLSKVTINGDSDLVATNIKQGVNIFGIEGTYQGEQAKLQEKTATPSKEQQVINADEGYDGLSQVTINGDEDLIADNIKKDVNIFGVVGTYEGSGGGGSAELVGLIEGSITDLSIPEGVTKIRSHAFYYLDSIKNVTVPEGITNLGDNTFYNCTNLTNVTLPEGVSYIGNSCFHSCSKLNLSKLPDNTGTIGPSCFFDCTNITVSEIPKNVGTVSNYAFYNCPNVTINKFKNSVGVIGTSSFSNNTSITKVFISKTVAIIDANSSSYSPFYGCTNLTDIYTSATEKPANWDTYFNYTGSSKQATVHYGVSEEEFDAIVGGA